jgi:MFS family permease
MAPLLKTDGAVLSEPEIRRGMRVNMLAGALGTLWGTIAGGIPVTMFMECVGASGVLVGLTVTVQQLAMLVQIPAALLTGRLAARKPTWAALIIAQRMLWVVPALLPWILPRGTYGLGTAMVAVVALSAVLAQAGTAPWWSWMADLIPERERAAFWGRRQSFVTVASLLGLGLSGFVLDAFPDPREGGSFLGFSIVFGFAAVAGTLDIVVHLGVPEPAAVPHAPGQNVWRRIRQLADNRDFVWITLAIGTWSFALGLVGQFSYLHLSRDFGVGYTDLSLVTVSATLGVILSGMAWGYAIDRLGARNVGAIMMRLAPLAGAVWFFMVPVTVNVPLPGGAVWHVPQPVLLLLGVNLVAGALYSAVGLSQISLLSALTPGADRTLAMAVHWSAVGLMAALGPLAGGAIMDWFTAHPFSATLPTGTPISFFHVLVLAQVFLCAVVAAPLLLRVRQPKGEPAYRTALARLYVGNPLRAVSNMYHLYALAATTSSASRAEAARRLGQSRTSIAVRDLIERLEDPSAEVREEAAMALGRIGVPEAVEALLVKLEDPEADLGASVARALRQTRDPRAVEILIRRLYDPDREMVTETARTLGEMGDTRARRPLLDVLHRSQDPRVVTASSQALARLGEMAAIYEILPRMQSTRNPVLKRSLAVAVGDLLGEPGDFYRILTIELRERGTVVEALLDELSRRVRESSRTTMTAEGEALTLKVEELRRAYLDRRSDDCVTMLFNLAIGLAALHYGIRYGGDAQVFVEVLLWRNPRFGTGVWYLDLLREPPAPAGRGLRDDSEILLGIYFLSRWSPESA